jgi:hypothetical protein
MRLLIPLLFAVAVAACSDPPCRPGEVKVGLTCYAKKAAGEAGLETADSYEPDAQSEQDEDADTGLTDDAKSAFPRDASQLKPDGEITDALADADTDSEVDSASSVFRDAEIAACVPSVETCDGKDEDCDGLTDEGVSEGLAGTTCSSGGQGACSAGTQVCFEGAIKCSASSHAADEICDGIDNDCDGDVDDGVKNACGGCEPLSYKPGDPCTNGQKGVCAKAATYTCNADHSLTCKAEKVVGSPQELCGDDLDNDCDGSVDNDCNACGGIGDLPYAVGAPCNVVVPTGQGSCSYPGGGYQCAAAMNGTMICQGGAPPEERCDGVDNDCNGLVDDLPVAPCDYMYFNCKLQGTVVCATGGKKTCAPPPTLPEAIYCVAKP